MFVCLRERNNNGSRKKTQKPHARAGCETRAHNFEEVALGYDLATAKAEAERCLNCKAAPCMHGCPVSVRIPEFLKAVREGDIEKAGHIIKSTNSLPSVCGRVCPQENQCEKLCVRGRMEGPVAIGSVERFVGDYMLNVKSEPAAAPTGKKVAVIGSGPAGLTCAGELASAGVEVTVYEAFHRPGGVLVYGIPEFRLPKRLVAAEIDKLKEKGVHIELNSVAGKTVTIEELIDAYDAVFIGSGAGLPMFMGIEGENLNGVLSANEFLTRVNLMKAYDPDSPTPVIHGKHVCVVGARQRGDGRGAHRAAPGCGDGKDHLPPRPGRDAGPKGRDSSCGGGRHRIRSADQSYQGTG